MVDEGIQILEELCTSLGVVNKQEYIERAVKILEPGGYESSQAVARLLLELLEVRSSKVMPILEVAQCLDPAPVLIDAVITIKTAGELNIQPSKSRFIPEISGEGKVGWTSGTAEDIKKAASLTLERLTGVSVDNEAIIRPGAYLKDANLVGAELEKADFTDTNLREANLTKAVLRYAKLKGANLEGAKLQGANLYFADLSGANLKDADLREANLTMANLKDTELSGADVHDAHVYGTTGPDGSRCDKTSDLEYFTGNLETIEDQNNKKPVPNTLSPQEGGHILASPIAELLRLKVEVENLGKNYPANQLMILTDTERLKAQIPWISRTLNEAAEALKTKSDKFGNPITQLQVLEGLVKLVQIVQEPEYNTLMEIACPGIGKPLQECMGKLQTVIFSLRLEDNGDETVLDHATVLIWQKTGVNNKLSYGEALIYCQKLNLAGHFDWRLPFKDELINLATVDNAVLKRYFPDIKAERYWASTDAEDLEQFESKEKLAYTVDFDPESSNYGCPITYFKSESFFVRAVKSL